MRELWGFDVPAHRGLNAVEMIEAAHDGRIDWFYVSGGNFLETLPEPDFVREAIERVREFIRTSFSARRCSSSRTTWFCCCPRRRATNSAAAGPKPRPSAEYFSARKSPAAASVRRRPNGKSNADRRARAARIRAFDSFQ